MDINDHMPRDPALEAPLAALRTAMAAQDAPRGVEKELLAAFAKQHARRRWYQALAPRQWRIAGGVGALSAVVVVLVLALHTPAGVVGGSAGMLNHDDGTFFIALESLERIESEPYTRVVEAELPQTALAQLGMPLNPQTAGDTVRAEMLVAEARALTGAGR